MQIENGDDLALAAYADPCRPNPHLILYRLDCAARDWAAWTGAATASGTPSAATARREAVPLPWTAGGRWRPRRLLPRRPPPPTPTPLSAGWTPSAPATAASPRAPRSTPRRSTGEFPHLRLTELLKDALLTVRVRRTLLVCSSPSIPAVSFTPRSLS